MVTASTPGNLSQVEAHVSVAKQSVGRSRASATAGAVLGIVPLAGLITAAVEKKRNRTAEKALKEAATLSSNDPEISQKIEALLQQLGGNKELTKNRINIYGISIIIPLVGLFGIPPAVNSRMRYGDQHNELRALREEIRHKSSEPANSPA